MVRVFFRGTLICLGILRSIYVQMCLDLQFSCKFNYFFLKRILLSHSITLYATNQHVSQSMSRISKYHGLCHESVSITIYVTNQQVSQSMSRTSKYHNLCHESASITSMSRISKYHSLCHESASITIYVMNQQVSQSMSRISKYQTMS